MNTLRRFLLTLLFSPLWASAQLLLIDGAPIQSGTPPRIFLYESNAVSYGYEGNFASTISGKCKVMPAGYTPGYVWVSVTKSESPAHRLGGQIPCDSAGNFSGTIAGAIDYTTLQYTGESSVNLFIQLCAFFCESEPAVKVVLRSLDASAFGKLTGTSQNKVLDFSIAIGNELSSYPGATEVYFVIAHAGSLYVVTPSSMVSCDSPIRLRFTDSQTGTGACFTAKIVPFSPATIKPFATAASGAGPGMLNVEFTMGPLAGLSGITFIGGYAKSFNELVLNHQWNVMATLY